MRMIPLQSSNLAGLAYQPGHVHFFVQFHDGTVYRYDGGQETAEIITDILFDPQSQGRAFNAAKYLLPYEKVEESEALDFHV